MRVATEQGFEFWHATGTLYSAAGLLLSGHSEEGLQLFEKGLEAYRATGAGLGLTYYLSILGEAFMQAGRFEEARRAFDNALELVETNDERFQEAELHRLSGELHLLETKDEAAAAACFNRAIEIARSQQGRAWELRATVSLARLWYQQGRGHHAFTVLTAIFESFTEGSGHPDVVDAAALLKELRNERLQDDVAAGIKYVRDCIPPPMKGRVSVDWRYVPSSTLGGDILGYHWVDDEHLALYMIDVTGHGLDSALLAITITNVIRSGFLPGADLREPDQVLAALNQAFRGAQHGHRYYTIWYGVYHAAGRTLRYASGGHPAAVVIAPGDAQPLLLPATGTVMGILRHAQFPAQTSRIAAGARLFVFSDGVYEIRRDKCAVWDLSACISRLTALSRAEENPMDTLLAHVRELRGSHHLDDDFSIIEADLH
jgi:serine phosphatase RsbU (regulator of sigma subunit)